MCHYRLVNTLKPRKTGQVNETETSPRRIRASFPARYRAFARSASGALQVIESDVLCIAKGKTFEGVLVDKRYRGRKKIRDTYVVISKELSARHL